MAKSYKGLYKATHPKKYVGNPNQIVYRSLLERRFMRYCDLNTDIVHWASEELPIKYYSPLDKKWHRYFPDFVIKTIKDKKYMIEIKPSKGNSIIMQSAPGSISSGTDYYITSTGLICTETTIGGFNKFELKYF